MIEITIEDYEGVSQRLEIPGDMGLSLMEVMKASEYPILATCGGMALCATCHVEVAGGGEMLPEVSDAELDILDTLPDADGRSRLACQLRVDERMQGATFRIRAKGA